MCHPLLLALQHRVVRLAVEDEPPLEGLVHVATPDFLLVRTGDGRWRVVHATEAECAAWS